MREREHEWNSLVGAEGTGNLAHPHACRLFTVLGKLTSRSGQNVRMAYDEGLADRLLEVMADDLDTDTRKMFGGLAVMWNGNMLCGVMGEDLMVRVGPEQYEECLELPGARVMDFTGRPMKGMLTIDGTAVAEDTELEAWVERCEAFVGTLPPK